MEIDELRYEVLIHQVSPTEYFEPFTSPSKCVGQGIEKAIKGSQIIILRFCSESAQNTTYYNYRTHMKITPRMKWTKQDTELFYELISLDMGALIVGAKYCGEFEDRLKAVFKEVAESDGQITLFIDEIHTVVGAGATNGAMDAGNLLKLMLSRRELRCIGATTLDEYCKYIEKDRSLEHRFQQLYVDQPTIEDTVSIHHGLHERYELHHGVRISDNALVEAAILSDRSISGRFLPDKAIVLVDEAAAKPIALDEISRAVLKLEMERLSLTSNTDKASKDWIKGLHLMNNTMVYNE
ncbi:chaperone protein ClpB3, chloroplastic-like [Helianthus annuus]|uniref:chaperone protein ClpB3, chloroplastic-like n=1 Tax=Helianthus annuus TaxID=4232 RepID=UPI001653084C|nr:chaperone protein ClpB3, chloroplastic-like [Helianthus annuus]